jgi:hypothetical protein
MRTEGHKWGIEYGEDRGAPLERELKKERNQCGIEHCADGGAPVWNRTGCGPRGTSGE